MHYTVRITFNKEMIGRWNKSEQQNEERSSNMQADTIEREREGGKKTHRSATERKKKTIVGISILCSAFVHLLYIE